MSGTVDGRARRDDAQPAPDGPKWLKPTVDYGPLLVFLGSYLASDIRTATAAVVAAAVAAVALSWLVARRIPLMTLVMAGAIGLFGGLTLILRDDTFIKMKPTIVQTLFALVLWASLALRRPLLKVLLQGGFPLRPAAYVALTHRFAVFFLAMAGLNEVIWRTQPTDLWVTFDTVGQIALSLVFIGTQVPFMMRHQAGEEQG
ncbi:intracellular septation protein [Tistlia consotensis]|uniref:Inner membrane-spanning protein YciB n=1 Tax=Tistlia consotensis USBA 355 TaxID=560819 RepID=A0A1Y6CSY0_9PROT|nr:inner membrane-spanning protein YciB [Tistlia consotensis]SMF75606.1 intracellular septation protein [Tistlia consotensis USBA 355]SNS07676.1 intracellular septation protein [Tistlia consotensis]